MTTPRSHSHGHSHGAAPVTFAAPIERALRYAAIACAVLTVVGLVALWPSGDRRGTDPALLDFNPLSKTYSAGLGLARLVEQLVFSAASVALAGYLLTRLAWRSYLIHHWHQRRKRKP